MKKFIFALLGACLLSAGAFGENALRAGDAQRLEFGAVQNTYDEYSAIFTTFDKGSTLAQSYEKLAKIHAIVDEKNADKATDADKCACFGLVNRHLEPYKDFHHHSNKYIWQGKKLTIERECWGSGEFYFELEEIKGGVQITTKFTRE